MTLTQKSRSDLVNDNYLYISHDERTFKNLAIIMRSREEKCIRTGGGGKETQVIEVKNRYCIASNPGIVNKTQGI